MWKFIVIILVLGAFTNSVLCQTQNDTIFSFISDSPVVVDGQATEECWANADWHAIDQVWIPYNANMKEGDFEGRFKVSWDESYLYVLVEVVDDSLSDDHSNPLSNWWNDDCLEIFIDEDRSKGNHERNCNAFAYHVSLFYDAVDLNSYGQGVNYKDNIEVEMDTIGDNTYLWEFAIKIYDATFNINDPENSRIYLDHNKNMGLAIAYCDNDETSSRENFIGSMFMTASTANDMYKNADHFGLMVLVDPNVVTNIDTQIIQNDVKIFPVPAENYLRIETSSTGQYRNQVSVSTISGQVIKNEYFDGSSYVLDTKEVSPGYYVVKIVGGNNCYSQTIIKR